MERGPQGHVHAPEYRTGCYRARAEDCCWVCLLRAALVGPVSRLKRRVRRPGSDSEKRDAESGS
ncbi:hypothetical protein [Saliphagus sp. LR7]|uniref:hypothetical protein n=1 Tax=Saliphagus sp. LR7 TaxID=2282654 RepID=UPI0013003B99|nr:hypothetical protein [Saliphagus sp. LR7]